MSQPTNKIHVCANGRRMSLAAALKIADMITRLEILNEPELIDASGFPAATHVRLENLPLLAVAPDLLEILKLLIDDTLPVRDADFDAAVLRARTIIAKVEGRS